MDETWQDYLKSRYTLMQFEDNGLLMKWEWKLIQYLP